MKFINEGPIFFLYIISICFFTDIGGYVFGKLLEVKNYQKLVLIKQYQVQLVHLYCQLFH